VILLQILQESSERNAITLGFYKTPYGHHRPGSIRTEYKIIEDGRFLDILVLIDDCLKLLVDRLVQDEALYFAQNGI